MKYMKRFGWLFVLCSILLVGCSNEDIAFWEKEVRNTPARVVIDTVEKLIRAQSLFRDTQTQYELDENDIDEMFRENEYEILVDDHDFFYCYDLPNEGKNEGEFVVLAVDMFHDVLGKGTPGFRAKIKDLRKLPPHEQNAVGFYATLEIRSGDCISLPTVAPETGDFSRIYVPIDNLPSLTPEEVEAIEKRVKARLEEKIRNQSDELRDSINIQKEVEESIENSMRIKLR